MKILKITTIVFGKEVEDWLDSDRLEYDMLEKLRKGETVEVRRSENSHTIYQLEDKK